MGSSEFWRVQVSSSDFKSDPVSTSQIKPDYVRSSQIRADRGRSGQVKSNLIKRDEARAHHIKSTNNHKTLCETHVRKPDSSGPAQIRGYPRELRGPPNILIFCHNFDFEFLRRYRVYISVYIYVQRESV